MKIFTLLIALFSLLTPNKTVFPSDGTFIPAHSSVSFLLKQPISDPIWSSHCGIIPGPVPCPASSLEG